MYQVEQRMTINDKRVTVWSLKARFGKKFWTVTVDKSDGSSDPPPKNGAQLSYFKKDAIEFATISFK